ncbi:bifunctional methyltransferase/pyrophosphohydrolase YabN [Natronincola ferrireducens]|uniref:Tetrapyrrole methylase family protein / MazG family protein n=1 Tax=Natronincola ferrireducens TaxID=393762 RepID=A0A1G8WYM9_9FIRM|nr:nucleoside triphosphate pyrophosphohydrolase [Natronincola ferrireducens]SDJ83492.1 tetrapyrrole methylase family protein / MazG family protein [Natronincola ferrireducens]
MSKLTIVGLGPGAKEHLTLATFKAMKDHKEVYLRTDKHPIVTYLKEEGINYKTFDHVYEEKQDFQEVYEEIAEILIEKAKEEDILYAVPGHPYVAENTVQLLLEGCKREGIPKEVYPAMSFVDAMFMALEIDPIDGFKLLDGLQLEKQKPDPSIANIITQVYDPFIASEVKLRLMDYYDDEQEIFVVKNAGIPGIQRIERMPLYMLDRLDWIDYLTSLYIPRIDIDQKKYYNVNNLVEIMEILRSKEGCPWDIKQTHDSLKPYLIEESYEVLEAIDEKDDLLLEEELGDLLLQVIFHSQIAKERQAFTMEDVVQGICEKLVFRHPHVFKGVKAETTSEALANWEHQKRQEKQIKSIADSMTMIPKELPALLKAVKVQKKAADVGFDWDQIEDVVNKVKEELLETLQAKETKDDNKIKEEVGDLLFAVVNLARFLKVNPEDALNATCNKFIYRFRYIEEKAMEAKQDIKKMTLSKMDELWEEAKKKNRKNCW